MASGVCRSGSQALHSKAPPLPCQASPPTRGEIGRHGGFRQLQTLQIEAASTKLLISPRVGEMSGRTEGGVKGGASRVFLSFLARGRVSSLPRPVAGLAISKNWEAGRVVRASLVFLLAQTTRPAGAFAPDGWAGLVPPVPPRLRRDERRGPSDLTGQTFTEARTCGGSVPTKPRYRCATDPDTVTLPDTPVRSRVPARAMRGLSATGGRRGISCGAEKCESEGNQGVGGKGGRGISTTVAPVSPCISSDGLT